MIEVRQLRFSSSGHYRCAGFADLRFLVYDSSVWGTGLMTLNWGVVVLVAK